MAIRTAPPQAKYEELVVAIVNAVPEVLFKGKHPIKEAIDRLAEDTDLKELSLRQIASRIGRPDVRAQQIKHHMQSTPKKDFLRSITLEDVLRVQDPECMKGASEGENALHLYRFLKIWHLGHDLAWHRDNAPETIDFLHSLLCR